MTKEVQTKHPQLVFDHGLHGRIFVSQGAEAARLYRIECGVENEKGETIRNPDLDDETATQVAGTAGSSQDNSKEELKKLRDDYTAISGKKPFAGWDAKTLNEKIKELSA